MGTDSHRTFIEELQRYMPGISIDCVVFGYHAHALHVLLLRIQGTDAWALPGGFLPCQAEMDQTAARILKDRTGLGNIFLTQFHTFDSVGRGWFGDPFSRDTFEQILTLLPGEHRDELVQWFSQRFVSTAYAALVDSSRVIPVGDYLSAECRWVPLLELPRLVLDHREMVERALAHIRLQINYLPIGRSLLGETFTMRELQCLYEAILDRALDRGNFQRKMLKLGMLIREGKRMTGARNKAPYLYRIDKAVYDRLLQEGIGFH